MPMNRRIRARIAALELRAQGKTTTEKARASFLNRFEQQVDPTSALPYAERRKRARAALRAYMLRLAAKRGRTRVPR